MKMQPNIKKGEELFLVCESCTRKLSDKLFPYSKSLFHRNNRSPHCADCTKSFLEKSDFSWDAADKLCQFLDLPFVPMEFESLRKMNGDGVFLVYSNIFSSEVYDNLGWEDYFKEFKKLEESGLIYNELPRIRDQKFEELRADWGDNYDDEALLYLQNLYEGLLESQSVNGSLQVDQAKKLCKISLEIDSRIRAGNDIDKLLGSYDKLTKVAEFTPKNVKNSGELESFGEAIKWLEKRGYVKKYHTDTPRDIVDATLKNINAANQRLYTNESGIGEEISQRIKNLEYSHQVEEEYGIGKEESYEEDSYFDTEGLEDFSVEVDEFEDFTY